MAAVERDSTRPRRPNGLYRWHRRAGMAAAAFLILLLVTGVPLQFSAQLDLGSRHVSAGWILDWYGLQVAGPVWVSGPLASVADTLFLDSRPVGTLEGFHGAVAVHGLLAAAGHRDVLLLDPATATVLDRFPFDNEVRRIGRHGNSVAVETGAGIRVADAGLVNWTPQTLDPATVAWSERTPADPATATHLRTQARQRLLSVERLLQDVHSGRVLGTPGMVLVDLASALLAFLAVSGLAMWWRQR